MYIISRFTRETISKKCQYFLVSSIYGWDFHNRSGHNVGNSFGVNTGVSPNVAWAQRLKTCQDFLAVDNPREEKISALCVRFFDVINNKSQTLMLSLPFSQELEMMWRFYPEDAYGYNLQGANSEVMIYVKCIARRILLCRWKYLVSFIRNK